MVGGLQLVKGVCCAAVAFAAGCQSAAPVDAERFEFAVLGDNPYSAETYVRYERLIEDVNATPGIQWVIHVGDTKGGGESCSDESLRARFDLNQRFEPPFILTPGDNDWLDCVRESAGGYGDYERLDYLRKLFYPEPGSSTGGRPMALDSQSQSPDYREFVENSMWERGGIVFATLHVLGPTRPPTDPAVMLRRSNAASSWLDRAFDRAAADNASGVFLAMQADPWLLTGLPDLISQFCEKCPEYRFGLEWLYPQLVRRVGEFNGPVVLAVGDTHVFRVDKPLYTAEKELVANFTRLEVFGFPDVHWVRVSVDPATPQVFSFHQQLVPAGGQR